MIPGAGKKQGWEKQECVRVTCQKYKKLISCNINECAWPLTRNVAQACQTDVDEEVTTASFLLDMSKSGSGNKSGNESK